MSSAALDSVARGELEHRLALAEGLLSSLDTPRALDGARRFLDDDSLEFDAARAALEAVAGDARGSLEELYIERLHPRDPLGKWTKKIGLADEAVKKAGVDPKRAFMPGDASPAHPSRAEWRMRSAAAILQSGTQIENAVLMLPRENDRRKELIDQLTSGNKDRAVKEYALTPVGDLEVLAHIHVSGQPVGGQAVTNMGARTLKMGSTSNIGDFRHELGHALRASMSGEKAPFAHTPLTDYSAERFEEAKKKVAANIAAGVPKPKTEPEWEEKIGVADPRALDNWEENFAEQYRIYHRALYQSTQPEAAGLYKFDTTALDRYRKLHPGWARFWDAWYTAQLLSRGHDDPNAPAAPMELAAALEEAGQLEEFGIPHIWNPSQHPRGRGARFSSKGKLPSPSKIQATLAFEAGRSEVHRHSIDIRQLRDGEHHDVGEGVTVHRLGPAYEIRHNGRPEGGDTDAAEAARKAYELAQKAYELAQKRNKRTRSVRVPDVSRAYREALQQADTEEDYPQLAQQVKTKRRRRRRKKKGAKMQEASVTGNPPVPNSPSSQTTQPGAKQPNPWGGPNPALAADDEFGEAQMSVTKPPNLRDSEDWAACGNCVFYGKGQCNLYGQGRDGDAADVVHRGGYPVDVDDLCDSHTTLTPPDQQEYAHAQRFVDRTLREARGLAEAVESGDNSRAIRARARFDVACRRLEQAGLAEELATRLEELGIHMPHMWNPAKHPRASRGQWGHVASSKVRAPSAPPPRKPSPPKTARPKTPRPPKPGQTVSVAPHVRIRNDEEHGYSVLAMGSVVSRHKDDWAAAVRAAMDVSNREQKKRAMPSRQRHELYASAEQNGGELSEVKSDVYPGLERSPKKNWVEQVGGLPRYIERIAKHLHYEKGKPIGHAIAIAVNVVKKMCATGELNFPGKQTANPKSRAQACAAVAQWESKKARSKARTAARRVAESDTLAEHAAGQGAAWRGKAGRSAARQGMGEGWHSTAPSDSFVVALALCEAAYKPIPPSTNYCAKLLAEIARIDGPAWYEGLAELDEAEDLVAELGIERVAAEELVEVNLLRRLGLWSPAEHPRARPGKGGGRFIDVLGKIERAAAPRPRRAGGERRAAKAASPSAVTPDGAKKMTVEQHFATGARSPGTPSGGADALAVDMAIGSVLQTYPNLKDWDLEGPEEHGGQNWWKVHVKFEGGKDQTIHVSEKGETSLTAPDAKPEPEVAPPTPGGYQAPAGGYEATGDWNVVSHMDPGTVFKGADGHFYKLHGDEWIMGKKGKVKAAHLENLDTGQHKNTPYFAISGKEYEIHASAGTFTPKPAEAPTSSEDIFGKLLSSVKGQEGTLDSVQGKNIVITGTLPDLSRKEAQDLISAAGGNPQSSVTSSTHVLVTGDKVGATKINAAKKKGVMVMSWDEFSHLVEGELGRDATQLVRVRAQLDEATDGSEILRLRARARVLESRITDAEEAVLTAATRKKLPQSAFALPGGRYPIHDLAHARNALARVSQHGTPEEQAKVRAAVYRRYPALKARSEK